MSSPRAHDVVAGRYTLHREIGAGGFGTVWAGEDGRTGRQVAVKFVRSRDEGVRARLGREIQSLQALDHPHIVRMLDWGVAQDASPFLVTQLLDGKPLQDWIGIVGRDDAIEIVAQVADGLAYAAARGIVHRDLKPSNIIVRRQPNGRVHATVIDFGLALVARPELRDITKTGEVIGTPGYMSPEQLRADPDIGAATDVYSLGVLLFELITGRRPFARSTHLETAMAHLTERVPVIDAHGPDDPLPQLVAQMLAKAPQARPTLNRVVDTLRGRASRRADGSLAVRRSTPSQRVPKGVALLSVAGLIAAAALNVFGGDEPARVVGKRVPAGRPAPPPTATASPSQDVGVDLSESDACVGAQRTGLVNELDYVAQVPIAHDGSRRIPILAVAHDVFQTADDFLQSAELVRGADERGWALVLPRDDDPRSTWVEPHDGRQFANAIQAAADELCLDLDNVYLIGHGNGALVASQYACHESGARALATSAHRFWGLHVDKDCPRATVPTIQFSSLDDPGQPTEHTTDCLFSAGKWTLEQHEEWLANKHGCGDERVVESGKTGTCWTAECDIALRWCRTEGGRDWASLPQRPATQFPIVCPSPPGEFAVVKEVWKLFDTVPPEPRAEQESQASERPPRDSGRVSAEAE